MEAGQVVLAPGTPGSQLALGLLPDESLCLEPDVLLAGGIQTVSPEEFVIYKPRWGAFYQTRLEDHLCGLGVTTIFTGCNFPNCPRTSVMEASERDFRIVLTRDAVSGFTDRDEIEMARIGVLVLSTEELLARLPRV